ncbi:hypothetical protein ZOSMA_43G00680 [Zostera marina]|uniref:Uncharacterized protein n=1 Tax=Zostera marina TaxID=29655 RepID=A0A0K9P1F2_ZOSMR|nr:hypothetical protein ZOSMA_43G00680 [Zostera marina]
MKLLLPFLQLLPCCREVVPIIL